MEHIMQMGLANPVASIHILGSIILRDLLIFFQIVNIYDHLDNLLIVVLGYQLSQHNGVLVIIFLGR
jgi:hypothetical protein